MEYSLNFLLTFKRYCLLIGCCIEIKRVKILFFEIFKRLELGILPIQLSIFIAEAVYLDAISTAKYKLCFKLLHVQLELDNSNSLNSNFRITRVFPPVPIFFLHKVNKFTSDNSRSDNSRFRLTRADSPVQRPLFVQKYHSISRNKTKQL